MLASRRSAPRAAFALIACAALFTGAAFAQKAQLLVYTALETDQLKAYQEGFNKVTPTSNCAGCAIPPASSPPSCSPRRRIRRRTW
jgi:hypothetical protein